MAKKKERKTLIHPEVGEQWEINPGDEFNGRLVKKDDKGYLFKSEIHPDPAIKKGTLFYLNHPKIDEAMAMDINGVSALQSDVVWFISMNEEGLLKIEVE